MPNAANATTFEFKLKDKTPFAPDDGKSDSPIMQEGIVESDGWGRWAMGTSAANIYPGLQLLENFERAESLQKLIR